MGHASRSVPAPPAHPPRPGGVWGLIYGEGSQSGVRDEEQRAWDLDFFLLNFFNDSHRLKSVTQELTLAVRCLCSLFLIHKYKGKGVVRVNTRQRMYLAYGPRKKCLL